MKKIFFSILICVSLLGMISCREELNIKQDYAYSVQTLPLPKKLKTGERVPIEFSIIREGHYKKTVFKFRYFQSDGKGTLSDDHGKPFEVNRFYSLPADTFTLYYESACAEKQTLDFVFEDSFGQQVEYMVEFANDNKVEEE